MIKKFSKSEKIAIVVIVAIVVALAGYYLYGELQKAEANAQSQSYKETQQEAFAMGETMHLDVEEDQEAIDPNGESFEAGFTWGSGSMDVTIDSATLYDDPAAAGIPESKINFGSARNKPFLLVKATVKNNDADPEYYEEPELADLTNGLFMINFLDIPSGELCYFDGTSPRADEKGAYYFELAKGEERQFTLGFCVQEMDDFNNVLDVGVTPGKYWVNLDIRDEREGASQ